MASNTGPVPPQAPRPGPSRWVARWCAPLAPGARALDFAAGQGRNARPLLATGATVTAVDLDARALACADARLTRVVADLEDAPWPFAPASFDLVVTCNYLHRPRLDELFGLVRPGGRIVYETFARGNERYGRPSSPAFLLAPGELLDAAARGGFSVIAYEHGLARGAAGPAVVQRLCAARPPADPAACEVGDR